MSLRGGAAGSPAVLYAVPQLYSLLSLVVTRLKAAREQEREREREREGEMFLVDLDDFNNCYGARRHVHSP